MTDALSAPSGSAAVFRLPQPVELGEAVTQAIREMILSGTVAAGERLVETELAARFDTSRGPVRDAFMELETTGLLTSIPRRGTFVSTLSEGDIDELYTLRLALESLALRRLIPVNDDAIIVELRTALDVLGHAIDAGDDRAIAEADMALHRSIVSGAGHRRLRNAWEATADQTLLVMSRLPAVRPEVQSAAGAHRDIVDAVANDDLEAALASMTSHLDSARTAMTGIFSP